MKTLIYAKYYYVTGDNEVVYENGELIPVILDLQGNWGLMIDDDFVHLDTFEIDGVTWYFTNDYQEIEIREFVRYTLSGLGISAQQVEWFKTIPSGVHEVSYHAYFKLKDQQTFQTEFLIAGTELELLRNLLFYGSKNDCELHYGRLYIKTDGYTLYIGRDMGSYRLYTHAHESLPRDISDALEMREIFAPHSDEVSEVYYYRFWVFYRYRGSKRYHIDYSNTSKRSNSLSGMESSIDRALKHA